MAMNRQTKRQMAKQGADKPSRPEGSSSIGRAPVSKTGGWGFDSLRACGTNRLAAALSSRGLGRGPLKAQTRVRIPLALFDGWIGPIVYRLGRHPFTVQRGVRFPLGLLREAGSGKRTTD